ncbi:DNA-binding protein [Microbulbifer rhizosphaerae]|uniref:Chromosome segregation ATPase n=1 Tax=Microbulbifer rhizosphaerae TaxID=1562603 RepID=A0A7W4Z7T9_9GAMM|nr:DNA-binding protein [Microbulbifer rhizosphaerae]MBB3060103.1 chromosome segregation ATPase [Microbulbifer rhizosphaerae]
MARTGVTYLDIAQAAEAVKNRGEEPTVDRVRAALGTGSKSTITPLLKRWRSETGSQADTGGLPRDLVEALKALHNRVQQEADRKVEEAREGFEAAADKHRREKEEARAASTGLAEELRCLKHKLEISETRNRKLKLAQEESQAALAKSEFQREEGSVRIAELKAAVEELKQENRDIRDHFEHFQQRTADDRQQERDQFRSTNEQLKEQIAGLTEQLAEAGRRLREREESDDRQREITATLETENQQLQQQVSGYRTEVEALKERRIDHLEEIATKVAEINVLRDKVTSLSSRNASVSKEAELLRQSLGKVELELNSTKDRVILLTDENRAILQEKAVIQGQFKQLENSLRESLPGES